MLRSKSIQPKEANDAETLEIPSRETLFKKQPQSKEQCLNEMTNIATISALVGGFALTSLVELDIGSLNIMVSIASMSFYIAVHACIFAACSCAWIYRILNAFDEEHAVLWASTRSYTMKSPGLSFALGAMCYVVGVVFFSASEAGDQIVKLAIIYGIAMLCVASFMILFYTTFQ